MWCLSYSPVGEEPSVVVSIQVWANLQFRGEHRAINHNESDGTFHSTIRACLAPKHHILLVA
jgi:hypothetical protein